MTWPQMSCQRNVSHACVHCLCNSVSDINEYFLFVSCLRFPHIYPFFTIVFLCSFLTSFIPPSLLVSCLPLSLFLSPVGLQWVYLSCFLCPRPMQFCLYQLHAVFAAWRQTGVGREKKCRTLFIWLSLSFLQFSCLFLLFQPTPMFLSTVPC